MSLLICALNVFRITRKKVVKKTSNLGEGELGGCGQRLHCIFLHAF